MRKLGLAIGWAVVWALGPAAISLVAEERPAPLRVVASIFPLKEFAQAVAGERAEVSLFLPPGAEIHNWQPTPRQIINLRKADVFIYVGARLEPWADEVARSDGGTVLRLLEASRGLKLIGNDPHVWLDFELACAIVEKIRVVLSETDPEGAGLFNKNAKAYTETLLAMDRKYRQSLASCGTRTLVIGGHAAFGYLAARYGLTQVALYGLSPDSEPTPRHLIEVVRRIKEAKARAVFSEATVNPKLARLLAEEADAQILPLSDGVGLTADELASQQSFLDIMAANLKSLIHGLGCR
ncbi:MAG: hypothetical protein A2Y56_04240 [Candidatus Aminicenantes bacterium RBG_13_63_10]|nr:MAG: hypothetical protein A2Y56_04240 [Candidatus Aminicenantes bacterium RBG_13_63_10]